MTYPSLAYDGGVPLLALDTLGPGPWVDPETDLPPFALALDKLHVQFNEEPGLAFGQAWTTGSIYARWLGHGGIGARVGVEGVGAVGAAEVVAHAVVVAHQTGELRLRPQRRAALHRTDDQLVAGAGLDPMGVVSMSVATASAVAVIVCHQISLFQLRVESGSVIAARRVGPHGGRWRRRRVMGCLGNAHACQATPPGHRFRPGASLGAGPTPNL